MNRITRCRLCLSVIVAAALAPASPVSARERLLRCVTAHASTEVARPAPGLARRGSYAPLRDAMFFSRPGSACRWSAVRWRS